MHKVHRPTPIRQVVDCQRLWFGTHQPLLGFDQQIEFPRPIDPVDALVVPAKTFDVAQVQEAKLEASVALVGGGVQQSVSNILVFLDEHGLIAITGFADLEHLTSQANRYGVMSNGLGRHLLTGRWRHHFLP